MKYNSRILMSFLAIILLASCNKEAVSTSPPRPPETGTLYLIASNWVHNSDGSFTSTLYNVMQHGYGTRGHLEVYVIDENTENLISISYGSISYMNGAFWSGHDSKNIWISCRLAQSGPPPAIRIKLVFT
ncbi:MAG TPA: hypothetical protein VH396_17915 [Chitinophagaceae bacterium]